MKQEEKTHTKPPRHKGRGGKTRDKRDKMRKEERTHTKPPRHKGR
jgi:hypothetical protein